jgi:hypothetical protein
MTEHPVENPELEAAMSAVSEKDEPGTRERLYKQLLRAKLIVPLRKKGWKEGWRLIRRSPDAQLMVGRTERGEPTLTAFTSEAALKAWMPGGSAYCVMHAMDLFRTAVTIKAVSLAINVAGPVTGTLLPSELKALSEEEVPAGGVADMETVTPGRLGPIQFLSPRHPPPDAFFEKLRDRAASFPEIRRIYYFCTDGGNGKENGVVGIEFTRRMETNAAKAVFRDLGAVLGPLMGTDQTVDFLDLKAMGILARVAAVVRPAYEQKA